MNPRGRQFALAGLLDAWVRRTEFSDAEAAVIRRCYSGREVRTFSRYGIRQWAAPLRRTRVVVKDPFAVLSIRAICTITGATAVLLFRNPVAVLASYRRMGWTADVDELVSLGAAQPTHAGDAAAMITMWNWVYQVALVELSDLDDAVLVSHSALTVEGDDVWNALFARLDLTVRAPLHSQTRPGQEPPTQAQTAPAPTGDSQEVRGLHDFDRSAAAIEEGWRRHVSEEESDLIAAQTAPVWEELTRRQLVVPGAGGSNGEST